MGNEKNKNKDNSKFFKDFEKSAAQGMMEKVPEKVGDKLFNEISDSYTKGEISIWSQRTAKEVPKTLFTTSKAAKLFGKLQLANDIKNDIKKTHNVPFAVTKNVTSFVAGNLAGDAVFAAVEGPTLGVGTPAAVAAGVGTNALVSTGVNKAFDESYELYKKSKKWIKYYDELAKFKKLQPAKYDTSNKPIAGVANSQGAIDKTELIVTYPQPTVSENPLGWMAQLGSIFSSVASIISTGVDILTGGISSTNEIKKPQGRVGRLSGTILNLDQTYTTDYFPVKHTGGTIIPKNKGGRNEMIAILQGGETVRTEAQEKELQDAKLKEFLDAYAPLVSGENDENNPYEQVFGDKKSQKKDSKTPVLINKTRHDEETIIAIIADAWKTNRSGFRNILRYN